MPVKNTRLERVKLIKLKGKKFIARMKRVCFCSSKQKKEKIIKDAHTIFYLKLSFPMSPFFNKREPELKVTPSSGLKSSYY